MIFFLYNLHHQQQCLQHNTDSIDGAPGDTSYVLTLFSSQPSLEESSSVWLTHWYRYNLVPTQIRPGRYKRIIPFTKNIMVPHGPKAKVLAWTLWHLEFFLGDRKMTQVFWHKGGCYNYLEINNDDTCVICPLWWFRLASVCWWLHALFLCPGLFVCSCSSTHPDDTSVQSPFSSPLLSSPFFSFFSL